MKETLYLWDTNSSFPEQLNCITEGQTLISKQFHEQLHDVIFHHTIQQSTSIRMNFTTDISDVRMSGLLKAIISVLLKPLLRNTTSE